MGSLSKSFHTVSFGDEPICCVAFSPHEWSQNFIAAATRNKLIIASVQLLDVCFCCFLTFYCGWLY